MFAIIRATNMKSVSMFIYLLVKARKLAHSSTTFSV